MKFLSPEVALYLYKSTIRPCMEYCCHVWAGAPSCYLELSDKLQNQICRTIGLSLAASLEPLAHCWNVTSASLFYKYCSVFKGSTSSTSFFSREVYPLFWQLARFFCHHSQMLKNGYVNSFFPRTARLLNSLPIECFPII